MIAVVWQKIVKPGQCHKNWNNLGSHHLKKCIQIFNIHDFIRLLIHIHRFQNILKSTSSMRNSNVKSKWLSSYCKRVDKINVRFLFQEWKFHNQIYSSTHYTCTPSIKTAPRHPFHGDPQFVCFKFPSLNNIGNNSGWEQTNYLDFSNRLFIYVITFITL